MVNQKRPRQLRLSDIRFGQNIGIKSDDNDVDVMIQELLLIVQELFDMLPTRHAAKLPVKHEQQPFAAIADEIMLTAVNIR